MTIYKDKNYNIYLHSLVIGRITEHSLFLWRCCMNSSPTAAPPTARYTYYTWCARVKTETRPTTKRHCRCRRRVNGKTGTCTGWTLRLARMSRNGRTRNDVFFRSTSWSCLRNPRLLTPAVVDKFVTARMQDNTVFGLSIIKRLLNGSTCQLQCRSGPAHVNQKRLNVMLRIRPGINIILPARSDIHDTHLTPDKV